MVRASEDPRGHAIIRKPRLWLRLVVVAAAVAMLGLSSVAPGLASASPLVPTLPDSSWSN